MHMLQANSRGNANRRGTVLVMFSVCLIAIMGLVALVIDGGLLRAEKVRVQAVADAAARASACQLYQTFSTNEGKDANGSARGGALAIAADHGYANDGNDSTVVVNMPPLSGQYAGLDGYVEVLITSRQGRCFSNVWSSDPIYVRARAVARGAWVPFAASIILLDADDKGAVSVKGNGSLTSTGAPAYINSNSSSALSVTGGGTFDVSAVNITGGYTGNGITGTITTGAHPAPDPLAYLPAPGETGAPPMPSMGTVVKTSLGGTSYQYDLYPGTYSNLPIFGNGDKVIFHQANSNGNGGIYYLATGGLKSSSAHIIMAPGETGGLMIYNAGSGAGDTINITGNPDSSVTMGARTDGPYSGLVLFQSRTSTGDVSLVGNGAFNLTGTIYAPSARLHVTGNGSVSTMGSQWIGRNLHLAGNGNININYTPTTVARTRIVALME
jgi:hypothetical protein